MFQYRINGLFIHIHIHNIQYINFGITVQKAKFCLIFNPTKHVFDRNVLHTDTQLGILSIRISRHVNYRDQHNKGKNFHPLNYFATQAKPFPC